MRKGRNYLDKVLSITAEKTNISPENIIYGGRKQKYVDARQIFCIVSFYKVKNYSIIAKYLDMDHTSVINLCEDRVKPRSSIKIIDDIMNSTNQNLVKELALAIWKDPSNELKKSELKQLL